jgi:hypothetical protein
MRGLILVMVVALLGACSDVDPRYKIAPQKWDDAIIEVQTRPEVLKPGMNEFLLLATTKHGRPVFDMVVYIKATPEGRWEQTMEDGESGVYRRALLTPGTPTLYVKLRKRRTDESTVLKFPLVYGEE